MNARPVRAAAALLAAVTIVVIAADRLAAQPDAEQLRVDGADGWPLAATLVRQSRRAPGVLLLHQCDDTRASLNPLLTALSRAGLHALTFDYAGVGGSASRTQASGESTRVERNRDVQAVYDWFRSQPDVSEVPAVVGASCGFRQALDLARVRTQVSVLVVLAGSSDAAQLEWLRGERRIPVLGVAGREDGIGNTQRAVAAGAPASELILLDGKDHAAHLFTPYPGLPSRIAQWLRDRLVRAP